MNNTMFLCRQLLPMWGWIVMACASGQCPAQNVLLEEFLTHGLPLTAGRSMKCEPPLIRDGMVAEAQVAAIKGLVGDDWERFVKPSVTSRFELRIAKGDALPDGGNVQRLDLWFIGYGSLETIADKGMLDEWMTHQQRGTDPGAGDREQIRLLTEDELQSRNLTAGIRPDGSEVTYSKIDANIIEKVRVQGIAYGVHTRSNESLTVAMRLDEQQLHDGQFPAEWRPLTRNPEDGLTTQGEPRAYSIAAAYGKATRLRNPSGAILVEIHLLFAEPEAWFAGRNLLRAKLPPAVQQAVHKFRRRLQDSM